MFNNLKRLVSYVKNLRRDPKEIKRVNGYKNIITQKNYAPLISRPASGKKALLIMQHKLYSGGAEISLLNMLAEIPQSEYDITLILWFGKDQSSDFYVSEAKKYANVVMHKDVFTDRTLIEKLLYGWASIKGVSGFAGQLFNATAIKRAVRYLLGSQRFDIGIDWQGYHAITTLFVRAVSSKALIWQHNDIKAELDEFNKTATDPLFLTPRALKSAYRSFDKIVACGQHILPVNNRKLELDKFLINKTSYVTNFFNPQETIMRANEMLSPEDNRIIEKAANRVCFYFLGRLSYEKNLSNLIIAFSQIVKEIRSAANTGDSNISIPFLFLIGDGYLRKELEQLSVDMGVGEQIIFTGSRVNPFPFVKRMDCFVLASNIEGMSLALHEARSLKKAILLADFAIAKDLAIAGGQMIVGHSPEELARGMRAYLAGDFDNDYEFDGEALTDKSRKELIQILEESK